MPRGYVAYRIVLVDVLSLTVNSVDYSAVSVRPSVRTAVLGKLVMVSSILLSEVCNRTAVAPLGYRVVR